MTSTMTQNRCPHDHLVGTCPYCTTTSATTTQAEALDRARHGSAMSNYPAIFAGFMAMGLAESDIVPRVNVLTFNAWRAVGRQVRKGEHGVRVSTWVPIRKRDDESGELKIVGKRPKVAVVFHETQTDPV